MTEPKGQSFWATLPGLVTAVAGMITAIAILRSLTPSATCDCEEPTWSPDGTQIAYAGPGAGVVRPIWSSRWPAAPRGG
jgi:hypothetical protein